MAKEDYDDILNRSFDDLQDDKPLEGKWRLRVRNAAYVPPKSEDGSPTVLFFYNPIEPLDKTAEECMSELGDDYDPSENDVVARFWVDNNKSWKAVRNHLRKHEGVDWDGTIKDVIQKGVKGAEVDAELEPDTFEDQFGEMRDETRAAGFAKPEA